MNIDRKKYLSDCYSTRYISRYLLETHIKANARFSNGITYDARIVLYINHKKGVLRGIAKAITEDMALCNSISEIYWNIISHIFVKNYLEYFQMYPRHVMIH